MHIGLCGALSCTFARGTSSQRIFAGLYKRACPQSRFSRRRGTGIFGSSWLRGRCGEQVVAAFAQPARFGKKMAASVRNLLVVSQLGAATWWRRGYMRLHAGDPEGLCQRDSAGLLQDMLHRKCMTSGEGMRMRFHAGGRQA